MPVAVIGMFPDTGLSPTPEVERAYARCSPQISKKRVQRMRRCGYESGSWFAISLDLRADSVAINQPTLREGAFSSRTDILQDQKSRRPGRFGSLVIRRIVESHSAKRRNPMGHHYQDQQSRDHGW